MGALGQGLTGLGDLANQIGTAKESVKSDRLNDIVNQLKLQQIRQQIAGTQQKLDDTPQKRKAMVEQALGRKLSDQEALSLFGVSEQKTAPERSPYSNVRIVNGQQWGYNIAKGVDELIPGGPTATPKPSAGTQSGTYVSSTGQKGNGYRDPKTSAIYDAASGEKVEAKSFTPYALMPNTESGISFQTQQGPDGSQQIVAIPTTRTSGKGTPGGVSVGKPQPIGNKALPPALTEKLDSMVSTVDPVLEALKRMRANSSVLSDPMAAMKIGMASSTGGLSSLVSRGLSMTDQEKQYAADFETTSEGINSLRQALQATGFRGPYAWETLLQQRGSLLGRPDITNRVLDQSIKILEGQVGQAKKMLGGGQKQGPLTLDEARDYLNKAGGDKEKARQMARDDGRSF